MEKEFIYTGQATAPTSYYTQAVKVGNTVYLAGLCGDDPKTGNIMGNGDMTVEAKYAMENLRYTIEAAGGTLEDIVKVNVFVTDLSKFPAFNSVYKSYFPGKPPARIAMEVKGLADGASLELDAIAVL